MNQIVKEERLPEIAIFELVSSSPVVKNGVLSNSNAFINVLFKLTGSLR